MLLFNRITLTHFRNYLFHSFTISDRVIGICGPNASGKTNLLDAIYYLCFTKSYFSRPDSQSTRQEMQGWRIEGQLTNAGEQTKLICILRENNRKEFSVNNEVYKRFSSHIGRFPCVMIAPDDVLLITGPSEERRKFLDTLLSQVNPSYLQYLIDYNKLLQQRNSVLKAAAEYHRLDDALMEILEEQLVEKGQQIFYWRNEFLKDFLPLVEQQYNDIAQKNDAVKLNYYSELHNIQFKELLKENRPRDLYLQRTGSGIHKDDLEILMDENSFKSRASQGQRKSLLFALKMAEFLILKQYKGFAPVLLLDDVFEKLDIQRMHNLLYKVCKEQKGQVFITDTHKERLQLAFEQLGVDHQLIDLGIEN